MSDREPRQPWTPDLTRPSQSRPAPLCRCACPIVVHGPACRLCGCESYVSVTDPRHLARAS